MYTIWQEEVQQATIWRFMCQTASDVAHKMVDYNFGDIENVISIHDDLIIAGDDFESHHKTLIDVF